jgi:hypothetical protein
LYECYQYVFSFGIVSFVGSFYNQNVEIVFFSSKKKETKKNKYNLRRVGEYSTMRKNVLKKPPQSKNNMLE